MRTKYRLILGVTLILIVSLLLPACAEPTPAPAPAPAPTPAPVKPITLKFAYTMPQEASISRAWHWYAEEVEKRTGGKVKFDFYPGSTLFTVHETPDSIIARVADIANMSTSVSMKRFPIYNFVQFPGLGFGDTLEAKEAAGDAHLAFIEKYPEVKAEFKDWKVLIHNILFGYMIVSKVPFRVPDDLKGLKVGGTGPKGSLVELLGGAPVAMPPPECYMNMKTGVVDAVYLNWSQVQDYKIWEVADYYFDYAVGGETAMPVVMNWDSWNELPSDVQKVMTDLSLEARKRGSVSSIEDADMGIKGVKDAGHTIYAPTAAEIALWDKACEPIWYDWVDSMKAAGVTNAEEMLNYWLGVLAAYRK